MENKLILWDIDGTLMSCYRDGTLALNETFRRRTGCENACGSVIAGTLMDSGFVDLIMKNLGIPAEEKPKIKDEFAEILKEYVNQNKHKKVLPGVKQLLNILTEKENVHMGLITSNFQCGAEIKLGSVGLNEYFSFGGYGDHPGEKWDAAKLAIEEAEKITGKKFEKDNIFIIGDTKYDIECAKKIGVKGIAVATGWMPYEMLEEVGADYLLESLEDTSRFLEIINELEGVEQNG